MSDLAERLRRAGEASGGSFLNGLLREAADEIEKLRRETASHRWNVVAEGLVICNLQSFPHNKQTVTHDRVIHRVGCRYIVTDPLSRFDKQWSVHTATGTALAQMDAWPFVKWRLCGTCKPDIDISDDARVWG